MRAMVAEVYGENSFARNATGAETSALKDHRFTQVTIDWIDTLSNPAALFVFRNIMPRLKMYNLLWHWEPCRNTSINRTLRELIADNLLIRTETVGIYLVNPLKVWRGTVHTAVEATKHLLRTEGKPSREMIRDLKPKTDYRLKDGDDMYQQLIM